MRKPFGVISGNTVLIAVILGLSACLPAPQAEHYILGLGLFIGLFNNLALLIVFVAVYGFLVSLLAKSDWRARQILLGLTFGAFVLGCMQVRIPVASGVIVDQRNAVVILAGAFGGPLSALVCAAIAAAYRIFLGGSGVPGGVLGISLSTLAGIVLGRVRRKGDSVWVFAISAVASAVFLMPGFLPVGSWEKGWKLIQDMFVPYGSAISIGIFLGAILLANEERRKAAKDALESSEKRYRELFESNIDMIHRSDKDGIMRIASPSFEALLGYKPEELIGKPANGFFKDPEGARAELMKRMRSDGAVKDFEVEVVRKDGSVAVLSTNAKVLLDASGQFDGVEGVSRDITMLKKSEEERRRLEESLLQSQKMESVGSLAGGIAHDFNNILAAILGFSDIAKANLPPDSPVQGDLDGIVSAGMRAKELVNHILLFGRKAPRKLAPIRPRLLLRDVYSLLRASIPSTIDIKQDIRAEDGYVLADATSLHQVVMNLCANAAQAMEEKGGTLTMRLERAVLGERDLEGREGLASGPYLTITVSDTGIGIPPENLAKIFDPYFTTKAVGKGTGLGLSVVDGIVKSHGGMIVVESEPGKGSTFTVYLPEIPGSIEEVAAGTASLPRGTERIMVVDDEESLARVVSLKLELLGYRVSPFTDSRAALEAFRARPGDFDLILTDKTMPGLTGIDLARAFRALKPDLPVLLTTGYGSPKEDGTTYPELSGVLLKPVAYSDLASNVRRVLDEAKADRRM